jgi:hypothetical protein
MIHVSLIHEFFLKKYVLTKARGRLGVCPFFFPFFLLLLPFFVVVVVVVAVVVLFVVVVVCRFAIRRKILNGENKLGYSRCAVLNGGVRGLKKEYIYTHIAISLIYTYKYIIN